MKEDGAQIEKEKTARNKYDGGKKWQGTERASDLPQLLKLGPVMFDLSLVGVEEV